MKKITNLCGRLLEGCVWDEREQVLYFVDIQCRKIYQYHPESAMLTQMEVHAEVSCVVLTQNGGLIAGLADGLYRVDMKTKKAVKLMDSGLEGDYRYNDGKCDGSGRLWIGSMATTPKERGRFRGNLYCIQNESIRKKYTGFAISNGLCWSPKNETFYHIDTPTGKVDAYEVKDGIHLLNRRTAVQLAKEPGVPDGMCMDGDGMLFVAMWGAGRVLRCNPQDGCILDIIEVPDANVSCCILGGKDMDRLYVTTAQDDKGNGGEVYEYKVRTKGVYGDRYGKKTEKDSPDYRSC